MSACLVDRDDARIRLDDIQQEFLVTHAAEFVFFPLGRQAGKVIFVAGLDTSHFANYLRRERDSTRDRAERELLGLVFASRHPYGRDPKGDEESVKSIEPRVQ